MSVYTQKHNSSIVLRNFSISERATMISFVPKNNFTTRTLDISSLKGDLMRNKTNNLQEN